MQVTNAGEIVHGMNESVVIVVDCLWGDVL